jgi:hypothetical protein
MTAVLARLYICAIILIGALLFAAVDWFEPNHDVASLWATEAQRQKGGVDRWRSRWS